MRTGRSIAHGRRFRPLVSGLELLENRSLLAGIFQFAAADFYVGENGGNAQIVISRSGNTSGSSSVTWGTSNGTAQAGIDYDAASGVLNFAAGQLTQTVFIHTRIDQLPDGNETVVLTLSQPTNGASLGARSTAVLTILDASVGFSETQLTNQLNSPVAMAIAPDGRVFVAEQAGTVRVIKNDTLLATPFATVGTLADDEEGLVGIAFDPNFASNGHVYVTYTVTAPVRHNVIARLTANGDVAVPGSELRLFEMDANNAHYHIGGALHFGSDGKLYASTGDNADGNNSANLSTTHGKILRINPDGSIPSDNPFYAIASGNRRAIWALGLRNAFTFDIQASSGRMFISEVGGGSWEEVNEGLAGANYGWPSAEGPQASPPTVAIGTYRNPVHSYPHGADGYAITGAAFYDPNTTVFPAGYEGMYFYTEYVNNEIRWIDPANPTTYTPFRATAIAGPVDIRVAPSGALYYLARGNSDSGGGANVPGGSVFKVQYTGSLAPSVSVQPISQTVPVGQSANFSIIASGPGTLTYQWQRNGTNIGGANSASYTTPATVLSDDGALFRCVVTNFWGSTTSNPATLNVTANQAPIPTINIPTTGSTFRHGDLLAFAGSAFDPEDGILPATAYRWRIDYFTNGVERPALPNTYGITSGTYPIPTSSPYKGIDVFYRVSLTVTDSGGQSTTIHRDVLPVVVSISLGTNVSGLAITLDGAAVPNPYTFQAVAGLQREIGTSSLQTRAGVQYDFVRWSDNLPSTHTLYTPSINATYLATFQGRVSATGNLVLWSGDYVSTDTAMQRYNTPIDSGLTLDASGVANDYRWHLPLSDTQPINPNPTGGNAYGGTYDRDSSWKFYGGLLFQSYDAPFSTRWAEIWGAGPGSPQRDNIYVHAGSNTATDGWEFLYWKKQDFAKRAVGNTVQFTPTSSLTVEDYLGSDGIPSENSGRLRFVVRDGNQFYISQDYAGPAGAGADFILTDPNSRLWASYSPTAPYNVKFNVNAAVFAPHYFADVTAVGIYHSNDNSSAANRHAGVNFAGFRVTGGRAGVVDLPHFDDPAVLGRTGAAPIALPSAAHAATIDRLFAKSVDSRNSKSTEWFYPPLRATT